MKKEGKNVNSEKVSEIKFIIKTDEITMGQALSCTGCGGCNYGGKDDPKDIVFDVRATYSHLGLVTTWGMILTTTRN